MQHVYVIPPCMNIRNIDKLLEKYANNACTEQERILLELWFESLPEREMHLLSKEQKQELWKDIEKRVAFQETRPRYLTLKRLIPYAAAVVLMGIGLAYFTNNKQSSEPTKIVKIENKVKPGSDKAILTLADGRKIELNGEDGLVAAVDGMEITKTAEGRLKYVVKPGKDISDEGYNIIETPRGGQYDIVLADGTAVTLNAASSLRFPVDINSKSDRQVTLTGEGYFNVAKNTQKPFIVKSNQQEVKVLGTVFNVNSYDKTQNITTLLEGRVQINDHKILLPGQQARMIGKEINISQVDVDDFVDWKNNKFIFRNESLQSILERVSRWYDVQVYYANHESKATTFSGTISRYAEVERVLDLLESTSPLKFKLNGRTIYVH